MTSIVEFLATTPLPLSQSGQWVPVLGLAEDTE